MNRSWFKHNLIAILNISVATLMVKATRSSCIGDLPHVDEPPTRGCCSGCIAGQQLDIHCQYQSPMIVPTSIYQSAFSVTIEQEWRQIMFNGHGPSLFCHKIDQIQLPGKDFWTSRMKAGGQKKQLEQRCQHGCKKYAEKPTRQPKTRLPDREAPCQWRTEKL